MTTVSQIVTDAFREGNIISVGSSPTSDQQAEGLAKVNSFTSGFFGVGVGEMLSDWMAPQPQRTSSVAGQWPLAPDSITDLTSDQYVNPPSNSRIIWGGSALTVYFPSSPDDGSRMALVQGSGAGSSGVVGASLTLDGNGRTIGGSNTQIYTNPVSSKEWFYRADLGDWKSLATLSLTDDSLLPSEFDELISLYVFFRLSGRYGKQIRDDQTSAYKILMKNAETRYRQSVNVVTNQTPWREPLQSFGPRFTNGRWMT